MLWVLVDVVITGTSLQRENLILQENNSGFHAGSLQCLWFRSTEVCQSWWIQSPLHSTWSTSKQSWSEMSEHNFPQVSSSLLKYLCLYLIYFRWNPFYFPLITFLFLFLHSCSCWNDGGCSHLTPPWIYGESWRSGWLPPDNSPVSCQSFQFGPIVINESFTRRVTSTAKAFSLISHLTGCCLHTSSHLSRLYSATICSGGYRNLDEGFCSLWIAFPSCSFAAGVRVI